MYSIIANARDSLAKSKVSNGEIKPLDKGNGVEVRRKADQVIDFS